MSRDEATPATPGPGFSFAGLKVLVADDTFITQAMMRTRLTKMGCEVTVVDNGRDAVNEVKQQPFDCVIMDYHMPILDGVEATREIRRWEMACDAGADTRPRSFIVAFTATSQGSDRETLTAAGMDDFLAKPMAVEELVAILRQAAGRKPGFTG